MAISTIYKAMNHISIANCSWIKICVRNSICPKKRIELIGQPNISIVDLLKFEPYSVKCIYLKVLMLSFFFFPCNANSISPTFEFENICLSVKSLSCLRSWSILLYFLSFSYPKTNCLFRLFPFIVFFMVVFCHIYALLDI